MLKIMGFAELGKGGLGLFVSNMLIAANTIKVNFEDVELDPWFRLKPFIVSLFVAPFLWLYAWRTYSRREI